VIILNRECLQRARFHLGFQLVLNVNQDAYVAQPGIIVMNVTIQRQESLQVQAHFLLILLKDPLLVLRVPICDLN
jgi:hypothetical protein